MQAGRRESATRPGGQAYYQDSGARLQPIQTRRIREEFTDRAAALGYPDIEAMLTATAAISGRELARLLNVAEHRARYLRRAHGYPSPGHPGTRAGAVVPPPRPAALPTDRNRACLECGEAFMHLGKHLWAVHGLSHADYRTRHQQVRPEHDRNRP